MDIVTRLRAVIDLRAGAVSVLVMGSIVWLINMASTTPVDIFGSTTAALKQGIFSFFIGGLVIRSVSRLAVRPGKHTLRIILTASLLPGSLASALNYFVHSLRGTPSPFLSTIPVILLSTLLLPLWALYQRRKQFKT